MTKEAIAEWFKGLQDRICASLEDVDGKGKFQEDLWERTGGGGGRTRIIQGQFIEKGGVNFSAVHGDAPPQLLKLLGVKSEAEQFFATGVSIVLHPVSPMMPIIHMNVRYFELNKEIWWFGGGIDLTPHYIVDSQAKLFHQAMKDVCDKHHDSYYPAFKKWADDYFFIKHRNETRGIGGIFFDRLKATDGFTKDQRWAFVQDVGETFAPTYQKLAALNKDKTYNNKEKEWQLLRRGRYVEFNLVWDRGTKFGLDTNGRTESILMSLPATANWVYSHQVEVGSQEEYTLQHLKKGINWV